MKLAVISDTHARYFSELSHELVRGISSADLIVHGGDIVTMDLVEGLEGLAPVAAVCGNMDYAEVRLALPEKRTLELPGRRVGVVHGSGGPWGLRERVGSLFPEFDAVIFGHSHAAFNKTVGGTLFFNPGSARDSYGLLEITEQGMSGRIVRL